MTADQRLVLLTYADAARTAHDALTTLDQRSGDGDFGDNLLDGLDRVSAALDAPTPRDRPSTSPRPSSSTRPAAPAAR